MLKTIIVDDEPACAETLQLMLEKKFSNTVHIAAICNSAKQAINIIEQQKPDLLFLDVEMPGMSGLDMLQCLQHTNMHVIFTTAHHQYAIQAIKLNALDYLTKPISLQELTVAVEKSLLRQPSASGVSIHNFIEQLKTNVVKKISLPSANATQLVAIDDIVRIESDSNYSTVYFTNRTKLTVVKTLKEFEEQLKQSFIRIHQSHLVNLNHIIGFKNQDNGYVIVQGNELIEISRRRKQEVLQKLQNITG
jgi:two-component system LytT family response regulator